MTREGLFEQIVKKRSFLCVGLDTDPGKLPAHLAEGGDAVFEFNRAIVEATAPFAVAFKPNLAFYEERGERGWSDFERTCRYIRKNHPDCLIIADAKRGDIGNTSEKYARAFSLGGVADAVTVSPYMGSDSLRPFLAQEGLWTVILALTSNPGAADFELAELVDGRRLYERVLETSKGWGTPDNTMYVVGATRAEMLADVRKIVPDHFLLVPGVGAQGGSLEEVARHGMNSRCGLLVNSSRAIIYADGGPDFAAAAAREAAAVQGQMAALLDSHHLLPTV